jgi:hypothetical protein
LLLGLAEETEIAAEVEAETADEDATSASAEEAKKEE